MEVGTGWPLRILLSDMGGQGQMLSLAAGALGCVHVTREQCDTVVSDVVVVLAGARRQCRSQGAGVCASSIQTQFMWSDDTMSGLRWHGQCQTCLCHMMYMTIMPLVWYL